MTGNTGERTDGIDGASTIAEIDDAFSRQGLELGFKPVSSGWEAVISVHGSDTILARGGTRLEAARGAWGEYVERNAGTGGS